MIEYRQVGVRRGARAVLEDFSLTVKAGELLVLLGRSGAGKSTALKAVNRLVEIDAGELLVQERPVREWDVIALRRSIGYVIQEVGLFPHQTVARNIATVPYLQDWQESRIRNRVSELLTLVGLEPRDFADRYPHQLSGGQRQRVGVARALAAEPSILLMDEPFGALDPITRDELQGELLRIHESLQPTIVLVTHDVREAIRLGQRIAVMAAGHLLAEGNATALVREESPEVAALFRIAGFMQPYVERRTA